MLAATTLLNFVLLLVLSAGNMALIVAVVNRLHGRPLPEPLLKNLRHAHDATILLIPFVLVWLLGFRGPRLLTGGRWADLSGPWQVYLALCGLGSVMLAASAVRWWLRKPPAAQLSNHTWIVDIAERLGRRPIGDGPYRMLTRVPRNEIFRVAVSEKRYQFPRLPRAWHGLSILHLTDMHFIGTVDRPYFEEIAKLSEELEPDLIVFTGDLLDRQHLVEWLPSTLGRLRAPLGCHFILGNHDWVLDSDAIRSELTKLGWNDVAGKTIGLERDGRRIILGGTEYPWMGAHPEFGPANPDDFRVLLSHTPDNLPWARKQNVDLMLSGHNHGGQVVLPVLGPIYSPSKYGVRYSGGVFFEDPTLLYVSRGLSAKHALRINCNPELTKLVLETPH
ncbi:MAG: metallophosphoesterase [Planctomycetaceae bacterium]